MATRGRGQPSKLSDPEFAQQVAEALADGWNRQKMCDHFGIKSKETITRWKRDPRVKSILVKLINERVQEVTRKVDSKIAAVLDRDDLTIQELVMIRKEYLGGALRSQAEQVDDQTITEAMKAAESPDFQKKLAELFGETF